MRQGRLLGLVALLVLACVPPGCGRGEARAQLMQKVGEQLQAARAKADAYDFEGAHAILRALQDDVKASPAADAKTYKKVLVDIEGVRRAMSDQQADYTKKTGAGWRVIDGRLVSPADQERAIADKERREEEEGREQERRQAELQAQEERARQAREQQEQQASQARQQEEAQRKVGETVRTLPALQTALDEQVLFGYVNWLGWYLGTRLKSLGGKPEKDPSEYLIEKPDLIRRIRAADARGSLVLLAYRDEILDFVENLDYATYVVTPEASKAGDIPIRFALHQNQPVLLLGTVFSDTLFNNANQAMNTPKKRAAAFAQKEVLPTLLNSRLTDRLKGAKLGYVGLTFVYGNSNFVRDKDTPTPELLCLVISTRDFAAFVNRQLSQEALVKNSAVFLASESPQFVRVELTLE